MCVFCFNFVFALHRHVQCRRQCSTFFARTQLQAIIFLICFVQHAHCFYLRLLFLVCLLQFIALRLFALSAMLMFAFVRLVFLWLLLFLAFAFQFVYRMFCCYYCFINAARDCNLHFCNSCKCILCVFACACEHALDSRNIWVVSDAVWFWDVNC